MLHYEQTNYFRFLNYLANYSSFLVTWSADGCVCSVSWCFLMHVLTRAICMQLPPVADRHDVASSEEGSGGANSRRPRAAARALSINLQVNYGSD
jgi:hypothetical protein